MNAPTFHPTQHRCAHAVSYPLAAPRHGDLARARHTRQVKQRSWARAAWQGYRTTPWQTGILQAGGRGIFDYSAQATANLLTDDNDTYANVNILETGMSAFGLRPAAIGFGSAAFNLNARGYLKTVFHTDHDHRVYPKSFIAQALIGTAIGRGALVVESRILEKGSKAAALGVYMHVALRQPYLECPVGTGLYHVGREGIPALIGVVEETSEGVVDTQFTPTTAPDSHVHRP